jgi:hypothetical protein
MTQSTLSARADSRQQPVRDLHWIRSALQTAIAVEHGTMPLYAAAMYSLEVQNYPAYNTLRSVLMEEMLHMAAACNTLAAIGGAPRLKQLDPWAITAGLPAGIAPSLKPRFAKLSRRQLDVFMRIESPVELLPETERQGRHPTIGTFYQSIRRAVVDNAAAVTAAVRGRTVAQQVGGNLGYAVIDRKAKDPVEQILASIDLIIDQGEGMATTTRSTGKPSQQELSHYARFAELRFGRAFTGPDDPTDERLTAEGQRRYFRGQALVWPTVINSLAVPSDAYAAVLRLDPDRVDVLRELRAFDAAYSRMLAALDDSWNGPAEQSWPALGRAVFEMNELRVLSCFSILRRPVPAAAVSRLAELYPGEIAVLGGLCDLDAPLFYGPRFLNTALPTR